MGAPDGAIFDFVAADGRDGKQKKVRDKRRRDEVEWDVHPLKVLGEPVARAIVIMVIAAVMWGDDSQVNQRIDDGIGEEPRNVYRHMKGEEDNNVCNE